MLKTSIAAAVLALAAVPFAAGAAPSVSAHGVPQALPAQGAHPDAAVLYDQSSNDSGIGIVSQNFESSYDIYDSQAADDFTIPTGQHWNLTEIIAIGVYFNGPGPARDETVTFYRDKNGRPGKVVAMTTAQGADNGTGTFTIKLPWIVLWPGHYWVSVQANMDFAGGTIGEWGWENQTTSEGRPAMWRNPGDGFATGCVKYAVENVCIPDGQGDHMFILKGRVH